MATRDRTGRGALLAASLLLLAACGSGGSDGADATTTSAAESSSTTTTTTLSSSAQTDAASLTAADMGAEWRVYPDEPKSETGGGEDDGCAGEEAAQATDSVTATTDGELLQRGELDRYVQSITYELASAEDAAAFAASRLTDTWIECVRTSTEDGLPDDPVQTVKTYGVDRAAEGDFVGQYSLEFDEEIDGTQQFAGAYASHSIWLKGTVVVDLFVQAIARQDDPAELNATVDTEIDAGLQKALGRITV